MVCFLACIKVVSCILGAHGLVDFINSLFVVFADEIIFKDRDNGVSFGSIGDCSPLVRYRKELFVQWLGSTVVIVRIDHVLLIIRGHVGFIAGYSGSSAI